MTLTKRELEILKLTADDCLSSKQISERLFISVITVKNHIKNIKLKEHVSKITELSKLYFTQYSRQIGALALLAIFSITFINTNPSDIRARRARRSGRRWDTELIENYGIDY